MSETSDTPQPAFEGSQSPGRLLRAARESRGLHIAALAAAIKVSPRKLDALENDRLDELPDATFARALASTVCRSLKVNAEPILALMPVAGSRLSTLEEGREGLNAPFEVRRGRGDAGARQTQRVLIVAGLGLVFAAGVLLLLPPDVWRAEGGSPKASQPTTAPPPAAQALPPPGSEVSPQAGLGASAPAASPGASLSANPPASVPALSETVHSAPPVGAAASGPTALPGAWIRVAEPSWVEALDGAGRTLLSRVIQPGESVRLDATDTLRMTIGNASATQVELRGQRIDLRPFTRENVARLELK